MLYREINTICSETHRKHINTPCGQNVESLSVKPGGNVTNGLYKLKNRTWNTPKIMTSFYLEARRKKDPHLRCVFSAQWVAQDAINMGHSKLCREL